MKEIHISKRNIFAVAILTLVIVTGILVIQNWPSQSGQGDPQLPVEDHLASSAAVSAIEKIFQVDYREGKETWLSRICDVSTPAGCQLFSVGAEHMWQNYADSKTIVTAQVQEVGKVVDNGSEQVWELAITLSSPLPGSNKTQDTAYIVLQKTDSDWKFDRFLMEPEVNILLLPLEGTRIPVKEGSEN
ncbi:MAG: hypothetical protein WBD62_18340 [Anaerolineales bacterium]|jgi:hypothetical protein